MRKPSQVVLTKVATMEEYGRIHACSPRAAVCSLFFSVKHTSVIAS